MSAREDRADRADHDSVTARSTMSGLYTAIEESFSDFHAMSPIVGKLADHLEHRKEIETHLGPDQPKRIPLFLWWDR